MLIGGFCADTSNIWNVLGYVVTVFKIVIPLILIILGMVDLGKAVVSSDDKQISKSVSTLIKRFIAAVIVFFIPTVVSALFNALSIMNETELADYNVCVQCVTGGNCDTSTSLGNTTNN